MDSIISGMNHHFPFIIIVNFLITNVERKCGTTCEKAARNYRSDANHQATKVLSGVVAQTRLLKTIRLIRNQITNKGAL